MEKKVYKLNRLETTNQMGSIVDQYWAGLRTAKERGEKVAWSAGPGFLLPFAMKMQCHFMAGYSAYCSGRGAGDQVIEAAESGGDLMDTCSYHKLHTGMFYAVREGIPIKEEVILPIPDLMISARLCPEQSHYGEALHQRFGLRVTGLDFPIPRRREDIPKIEDFVTREHKEILIPILEEICDKPFDYEEMRRILRVQKEACLLRNDCWEFFKKKPTPWTLWDYGVSIAPIFYMMGKPIAISYYKQLKEELAQRASKNIPAILPDGEKYRLMWDGWLPWAFLGRVIRKLAPYGAVPICGRYPWEFFPHPEKIDPDAGDIIRNWVQQWYSQEELMYHDGPEGGLEHIGELIEDYSIDGVIFWGSRTCRLWIAQYDLAGLIERKYGVPCVVIDADMTDSRYFSDAQIDTRLEAFFERIDAMRRR
jgi:benzoyl-CoA reductase/2-hydroxyglutaryl-CoA dehydratase subunit BcrC/BadD/HgdB